MIEVIITLAVVGVLLWLIETYVPMHAGIKKAIYIVAVICIVFYLLNVFGIVHRGDIPVPRLR